MKFHVLPIVGKKMSLDNDLLQPPHFTDDDTKALKDKLNPPRGFLPSHGTMPHKEGTSGVEF